METEGVGCIVWGMHTTNTHTDYFSPAARRARMRRANNNPEHDRKTLGAYSDAEIAAKRKAQVQAIAASKRAIERLGK